MTLLIFSNSGNWDRTEIGFRAVIDGNTVVNKGIIQCVQDFIKDDGTLEDFYEDEHKGLEVKQIGDTMEFYDLMDMGTYTLWADSTIEPKYFVHFVNSNGEWMYVIFSI